MSHLASASMAKSQIHKLKFHRSSPSSIQGHELSKHTLEEKSELSKSSDEDLEEKSELSLSSDEESEDTSELSESSDEEVSEGVVQADFAFFDPKPNDFHGVKILLQTFLDDTEWNLSGFVDLILEQTTVGTVVKIEDAEDDGLFSFVTVLNLARYKDQQCIKELKEYLLKVCGKDLRGNLRLLLGEQAQDVGLLVSQRVVNLPPQLLPPLYDALFDEVSWATEDEPTKELRNYFCFKFYLMVSRIYKLKNADQKKSSSSSDEEIIYVKPEDEIFHKLSSWSFSFPLHTQPPAVQELKNFRLMGLVMAVEAEKVSRFRQELKSLINES